jgi:hypothetical protein
MAFLFLHVCNHRGPGVDLGLLLLLPATTRPRLAATHLSCLLGAIAGTALFGMGSPDPRVLFVLEWSLLLAAPVVLWGCCERFARLFERGEAVAEEPSPSAGIAVLPRWFVFLRAGALAFAVLGGARLAALNATTPVTPAVANFFTTEQAVQVIEALANRAPGLLREDDLKPDHVMHDFHEMKLSASGTARPVFPAQDKILVLPVRLEVPVYYLPRNTVIPHWSRLFLPCDHDRTVCFFYVDGVLEPHYGAFYTPVSFRGFVPRRLMMTQAILVCRVSYDPSRQSCEEPLFLEGLALIPMDEGRHPRMDRAYEVSRPN